MIPLFSPKLMVSSKKKKEKKKSSLDFISAFPIFLPKSRCSLKKSSPEISLGIANFCTKIIVISKRKGSHLKSVSNSPLFVPKSQRPLKVDKKTRKKGFSQQICLQLLSKLTGQKASKNTARATQNIYAGHRLDAPGLIRPKLMLQTKNARIFRTSVGSLNFN